MLPAAPNAKNPFLNDDEDKKNDNVNAIIAFNNTLNNNYPYNQNVNGAHMLHTQKFTGTNFTTNTTTTSLSHHASPAKPPRPGPPARPPPPSASISSIDLVESSSAPQSFTADFAHANIPPPKPLPPIIAGNQTTVKSAFDDLEDTMRMALGSPSKGHSVGGQSMFVSSTVGQHFHHQQQQQTQQQQQMFSSNTMQQPFVGGLVSFYYYSHINSFFF